MWIPSWERNSRSVTRCNFELTAFFTLLFGVYESEKIKFKDISRSFKIKSQLLCLYISTRKNQSIFQFIEVTFYSWKIFALVITFFKNELILMLLTWLVNSKKALKSFNKTEKIKYAYLFLISYFRHVISIHFLQSRLNLGIKSYCHEMRWSSFISPWDI